MHKKPAQPKTTLTKMWFSNWHDYMILSSGDSGRPQLGTCVVHLEENSWAGKGSGNHATTVQTKFLKLL